MNSEQASFLGGGGLGRLGGGDRVLGWVAFLPPSSKMPFRGHFVWVHRHRGQPPPWGDCYGQAPGRTRHPPTPVVKKKPDSEPPPFQGTVTAACSQPAHRNDGQHVRCSAGPSGEAVVPRARGFLSRYRPGASHLAPFPQANSSQGLQGVEMRLCPHFLAKR